MAQRVLIELLLFLTPFAVFLVYRAASRDMRIKDRWPLTRLVLIGAGIAIAALIATPLLEPRESDQCFDPVRYDADGKIVPPREIPCEQQKLPGGDIEPNATQRPAPVAPRNTGGG
ncbi:MAG: DUF6111 family protein [Hyphomonadaceae bacterium]